MAVKKQSSKQLKLVYLGKNNTRGEYKLERATTGIGRSNLNPIVLRNKGISPFHARITVDRGQYTIRDLGAHEGIKVNGEKVDTKILAPGDEIQIGHARLKVVEDTAEIKPVSKKTVKKEKTPRRKKVKLRIPIRLIFILTIIFIVILLLNIKWLIQFFEWQ